jgi:hypothetical protein
VAKIGIENGEFKAAFAQRIAITRVLVQDFVEVGNAEIDGGQTVGEIAAGDANDGASEQAQAPME